MEAKIDPTELGKKLRLQGLEIVDVQAPNGKIIACAKQGPVDDISTIIKHLLSVGEKVDVQSPVKHPSKLEGPLGNLKVLSTWVVLPDGARYLSSINVIPKKGE